jgi:glycosyltransferase involved in cell wall biosynthesis
MTRFNYIVTIHNKEDLIEKVVTGILICAGEHSHIYLVLDGCTDGTERVVDQLMEDSVGLPITRLQAPDVHEILSLNIALRQVPQQGEGYNILVQDDVIIADRNFEKKVIAVNAHFGGRIGVLSFRHGINLAVDAAAAQIQEVDLIESSYGYGGSAATLAPGFAVERMVCLRSPQCVSFETVRQVGLLNEKYAPYTYDDHDYGMRCLQGGRTNVVYSVKFRSRVEWGGMRRKPQPGVAAIMKRNKGYVYVDYRDFISSLSRDAFLREPVLIGGTGQNEDAEVVLRRYEMSRVQLQSFNRRRSLDIVRRVREKLGL